MALAEPTSVTSTRGPAVFPVPDADRTVVWLRGEHDVSTVAALSQTIAGAMALDEGDLVIDLSGVHFMDAATVGVIIRARDFLGLQSRSLALRSPSTCAARILALCELTELLEARPVHAARRGATADAPDIRLGSQPFDRIDAAAVAAGDPDDLQQRARRGDIALLSLLRLDERTQTHRRSLAEVAIARLRVTRAARSTRFARPS